MSVAPWRPSSPVRRSRPTMDGCPCPGRPFDEVTDRPPPARRAGRQNPAELGGDAGRPPAGTEKSPVDGRPPEEPAGGIAELGPATGPHSPPTDDLGRALEGRAGVDRGEYRDLRRPDQPGEAPLGIPRPIEAALGGMEPGQVLGVAEEDRRPQQAIGPGLVE